MVTNSYPNDFYIYTKGSFFGHPYSLSPLRLGMVFGEIEGFSSKIFSKDEKGQMDYEIEQAFKFFAVWYLLGEFGRSNLYPPKPSVEGTFHMVLLSFVYHLAMSVLYLNRTDRYL